MRRRDSQVLIFVLRGIVQGYRVLVGWSTFGTPNTRAIAGSADTCRGTEISIVDIQDCATDDY